MHPVCHLSNHLEVSHHTHVFVLQIMAMKDIAAAIARESHQDRSRLSRSEIDRIFPSHIVWSGPPAMRQNPEMDQMEMERMAEVGVKPPDLSGVQTRTCVHAGRVEGFAVDRPTVLEALKAEIEVARDGRFLGSGSSHFGESGGDYALITFSAVNVESHDSGRASGARLVHQQY